MPHTNSYFSTTTGFSGEQQLLDDLTTEQIAIYGLDITLCPESLQHGQAVQREQQVCVRNAMPIPRISRP